MKVAYLLGSLNRGGTETLLLDVFRNASAASFEMIGIHRKGGAYREEFYATGRTMIQCAPKRLGWIRYLLRLRQILQSEKIDVVHAQQPLDCIYARLATIVTGIRVVETFHSYDIGLGRYHKLIRALSIRMADAVCFVSKAQRDYYKKACHIRNSEKLHVVYNGIDFTKFDEEYPEPEFLSGEPKANANASREPMRLVMVGNFVRGRSQMEVLKALSIVKGVKCKVYAVQGVNSEEVRGKSFDFYFVGGKRASEAWRYDECVQYCEEHGLNDCVHFVGGRGDVPAILQHIDGFVFATEHDTFGIAVVEAMANGLPMVVNDWDVMREITHDGEWATLYKTGDSEDCARALQKLIEHIDDEKQKAKENAAKVRGEYSIERHIQSLAAVYRAES